jgi:hypothetical protein
LIINKLTLKSLQNHHNAGRWKNKKSTMINITEELEKLLKLKEQGVRTDEEFQIQKKKILQSQPPQKEKPSSNKIGVLGLISVIFGVILLGTPMFLFDMFFIIALLFGIIGLFVDKNKVLAFIGLAVCAFFFFVKVNQEVSDTQKEESFYEVKYVVTCAECRVNYTNETGGTTTEEKASLRWEKTLKIKGDEYVSLDAQNNSDFTTPVTVFVSVNGEVVESKKSEGKYAVASVSFFPKNTK